MSGDSYDCPDCGEQLEPIGCEKTTRCERCGAEWKYGDGSTSLVRVEENDPIYWDR